MAFFTETFLNARREELMRSIVRIQYQLEDSIWRDGTISSKEIAGTDVVIIVKLPESGSDGTIKSVRVFDRSGELAGQQPVELRWTSTNTAHLRFTFPLVETSE